VNAFVQPSNLVPSAMAAVEMAILFWHITYSQVFSYHLFILQAGRLINNPLHTYTQSFSSKDSIDEGVQDEVDWLLHTYGGTKSV
jgi:hypothetical protein